MQYTPFFSIWDYICTPKTLFLSIKQVNRVVAQSGSVHVWGACGRRFKSCPPDQKRKYKPQHSLWLIVLRTHKSSLLEFVRALKQYRPRSGLIFICFCYKGIRINGAKRHKSIELNPRPRSGLIFICFCYKGIRINGAKRHKSREFKRIK